MPAHCGDHAGGKGIILVSNGAKFEWRGGQVIDVRSETWVTERSGDMGYTFRPEGGGEEMPWKERSVMDE
jgi:hypothetical protein